MTEQEWLSSDDGRLLQEYVFSLRKGQCADWKAKVSERKLRLLACACVRRAWEALADSRSRRAVEVGERYADGLATREELDAAAVAARQAREAVFGALHRMGSPRRHDMSALANTAGLTAAAGFAPMLTSQSLMAKYSGRQHHNDLVRDVLGNPFRSVPIDPSWRTEAVVGLALGIYEERAFDRLAVLADALEDAGCASPDILDHCRGPGPHVRGCWVIDLVLGKW